MKYFLKRADDFAEVDIVAENGQLVIHKDGRNYQVDLVSLGNNRYSLVIDHQVYSVEAVNDSRTVRLVLNQREYQVTVLNQRQKVAQDLFGDSDADDLQGDVSAPMPGMVLKIEVAPGQQVEQGQPLLIIEAMKMENEIRSPISGTVTEILVKPNQAVEKDDTMIRIE